MVKTSDFESENPGSSPGEAAKVVSDYAELVKRACVITAGPPFNMEAEEEFAGLEIDGETATLFWPEIDGGYYAGDGSIQRQSCKFPLWLLQQPMEAILRWKQDERAKYEAAKAARREQEAIQIAQRQEEHERNVLAFLKQKYG